MLLLKETKAISSLVLILLILCSIVFGAFISYMLAIANFYLEPENTIELVITEINFPVNHADNFNLTVMNPSHSASGTNITEIYFTVEGEKEVCNVTSTSPVLPIPIEKATTRTIICFENWGNFSGKTISVHVSAQKASGAVYSVKTEFVKLEVQTRFNPAKSVKYFNVTVENDLQSAIDLMLSNVYFDYEPVENMTITLPTNISTGKSIQFRCFVDWQGHSNPLVQVETLEGYTAEIRKKVLSVVILPIADVTFNETDTNKISVSLFNSEESATSVDITDIILTYDNGTEYAINGTLASPSFHPYYTLGKNKTVTFGCVWSWRNYRDRNVTITVYTKQGFTSTSKTVYTPQSIVFKITELNFNLTSAGYFLVNVTNMPCSLQDINITHIKFDGNETSFQNQIIPIGEEKLFNCTFDWIEFAEENVTITVCTAEGLNISGTITVPSVKLEIDYLAFDETFVGVPYVNITILNTIFSTRNVTITQIIFEIENTTYVIDGTLTSPKLIPDGYLLVKGANVTIVCPWNWSPYLDGNVTVIVQTADGLQVSKTVQVEQSFP